MLLTKTIFPWITKKYIACETLLGNMKIAVVLSVLFASGMVAGTFIESYQGADFANRFIYKSLPFMFLQALMLLSIYFATMQRLPYKKRLSGFYVIHLGLMTIGLGSYLTYVAGIDGTMSLYPNEPTREIVLNQDLFVMRFEKRQEKITYELPYSAMEKNIDADYQGIKIKTFLPFADKKLLWQTDNTSSTQEIEERDRGMNGRFKHSSQYVIKNAFTQQEVLFSLNPQAVDVQNSATLGPLTVHYLPSPLSKSFARSPNKHKIIIWDSQQGACFLLEDVGATVQTTSQNKRFVVITQNNIPLTFFPDFSPWPVDINLRPLNVGSYRLFSQKVFEEGRHLFLFGTSAAHFDDVQERWIVQDFKKTSDSTNAFIELPWMSMTVELLKHEEEAYPTYRPEFAWPVQNNNELIQGNTKALLVEVNGKGYWATNDRTLRIKLSDGEELAMAIDKKAVPLPFEFVLTQFHMDKDPGTENPASYESYVTVFGTEGHEKHRIFMNNPFKKQGLTFYQASYFQDPQSGAYGSVLSANIDPGRPWKYGGSLLLVGGSIAHYFLNRKKFKKSQRSS